MTTTMRRQLEWPNQIVRLALLAALVLNILMSGATSNAAVPGANGKIAFTRQIHDGEGEWFDDVGVYIMNADGTGQTRLTDPSNAAGVPAWSPDSTKIAFAQGSLESGTGSFGFDIYVMSADGSNQIQLTTDPATHDLYPAWSPDGTKIAFVKEALSTSDTDIYVMNADGSNPIQLTTGLEENVDPAWSPDGTKIAFRAGSGGYAEIYVINADGSNRTQLTNNLAPDRHPTWSPDGTKIAFYSDRTGSRAIWVMNADGNNQIQLTNTSAIDEDPDWSPDGTKITFARNTSQSGEFGNDHAIWVMNADGTGQTRLTAGGAERDSLPAWQPLPTASYQFGGFTGSIDSNAPNAAKAGQIVPVRWRLTDVNGQPISDPASFVGVTSIATSSACSGTPDAVEQYVGRSGLQYLGDGIWQYNWATPKSYAGQCRTMSLNLNDGSSYTAAFIFK